jgi:hypothetical protein
MTTRVLMTLGLALSLLTGRPICADDPAVNWLDALELTPPFSRWELRAAVALPFATDHPQGLIKRGDTFVLSNVNRAEGRGTLIRFQWNGTDAAAIELGRRAITEGLLSHPGGLDWDPRRKTVWVPLAEYRPNSRTAILEFDPATLATTRLGELNDHAGTVVVDGTAGRAHFFSWGTAAIYSIALTTEGRLPTPLEPVRSGTNGGYEYQDCKSVAAAHALCTGVRGRLLMEGAVDLVRLEPVGKRGVRLTLVKRFAVPSVDRTGRPAGPLAGGVPLTLNPMAFELIASPKPALRFYFVPHDGPGSRLLVYDAPLAGAPKGDAP